MFIVHVPFHAAALGKLFAAVGAGEAAVAGVRGEVLVQLRLELEGFAAIATRQPGSSHLTTNNRFQIYHEMLIF